MAEWYDIYPKDKWKAEKYNIMDQFSLKGKKGFITGGCGGLGRNTAAAWAENGADVDENAISYVNRLSDYFFVLARKLNVDNGVEDIVWRRETK